MCRRHVVWIIVGAGACLSIFPGSVHGQQSGTVCDTVIGLLPEDPSLVLSSRDTLATHFFTGERLPGCWLWLTGPSAGYDFLDFPHQILRRELPRAGWQGTAEHMADGVDITVFGMRRNSVLCLVDARWDGEGVGDPSYVPENRYELVLSCFEERS